MAAPATTTPTLLDITYLRQLADENGVEDWQEAGEDYLKEQLKLAYWEDTEVPDEWLLDPEAHIGGGEEDEYIDDEEGPALLPAPASAATQNVVAPVGGLVVRPPLRPTMPSSPGGGAAIANIVKTVVANSPIPRPMVQAQAPAACPKGRGGLLVKDLKEMAKAKGIPGYNKMVKAELEQALGLPVTGKPRSPKQPAPAAPAGAVVRTEVLSGPVPRGSAKMASPAPAAAPRPIVDYHLITAFEEDSSVMVYLIPVAAIDIRKALTEAAKVPEEREKGYLREQVLGKAVRSGGQVLLKPEERAVTADVIFM